jgi:hypothetical protein
MTRTSDLIARGFFTGKLLSFNDVGASGYTISRCEQLKHGNTFLCLPARCDPKFLHHAYVSAMIEKMGRKGMPEHVAGDLSNPGTQRCVLSIWHRVGRVMTYGFLR